MRRYRLHVAVAGAVAGAIVKIAGVAYGSRALLVDAATCIANLVALAGVLAYYWASKKPPDVDHPYGHVRLKYGGTLFSLLAYMYVAGFSTLALLDSISGYEVEIGSPLAAAIGGLLYALAIVAARGIDPVLRVYAGFTASEVFESIVSAISSFLGHSVSYLLDLAGGFIILAYIYHEAREAYSLLIDMISDRAAPETVYQVVEREARLRGLRPVSIKIRRLDEGRYEGDIVVVPIDERMTPDIADLLADELRDTLAVKGIELTIHVGIAEARSAATSKRGGPENRA
ncbi:cation transporter [Hyperthermus butylicus]|uniref:cation transporter n=1 Tax=Hyperthermus butylicus TaxID=54248 RepID=UPI001E352FB9|nr:cation transporter [Hyperthermus butylicus]